MPRSCLSTCQKSCQQHRYTSWRRYCSVLLFSLGEIPILLFRRTPIRVSDTFSSLEDSSKKTLPYVFLGCVGCLTYCLFLEGREFSFKLGNNDLWVSLTSTVASVMYLCYSGFFFTIIPNYPCICKVFRFDFSSNYKLGQVFYS